MNDFKNVQNGYLSLCYHYIRDLNSKNQFPRILGNSISDFEKHIDMFLERFKLITPEEASEFSYGNYNFKENQIGLLLTFDDGLSDHLTVAKILEKYGIKAIFFLPTCILKDELPANPIIIHYCIAEFGLTNFLMEYQKSLEKNTENSQNFQIDFVPEKDNPYDVIAKIKNVFKYELKPPLTRVILLEIYENMFHKKFSNAMEIMHLTKDNVSEILEMGHAIGTHTHSHISVGSSNLSNDEFFNELIEPKNYLDQTFGIKTDFLSYPFGSENDCLSSQQLILKTNAYKLAFTVKEIFNSKSISPLELGRYMPSSTDTPFSLYEKMKNMVYEKKS